MKEGVSAGEIVRRVIEAYTAGGLLSRSAENAAVRALLADTHRCVRAAVRADDSLSQRPPFRDSEVRVEGGGSQRLSGEVPGPLRGADSAARPRSGARPTRRKLSR